MVNTVRTGVLVILAGLVLAHLSALLIIWWTLTPCPCAR